MKFIDTQLVPTKMLYFMYYAGLSSFIPYKSIFQKQLGMSTGQNGLIQATMQLVSLFSPPVAGILTDKTKAYKIILSVCVFFSIAFTVPFYFVPEVERNFLTFSCCENINSTGYVCPYINNETNEVNCKILGGNDTTLVNATFELTYSTCEDKTTELECSNGTPVEVYDITFVALMVLTVLMSFFLAPVTPLVDASAIDTLGVERVEKYGAQRLWGAVGFGIVGLGVSYITEAVSVKDVNGDSTVKNYIPAFASATGCWLITILVITMLKIESPKAKSVLRGVGLLLKQGKVLSFLVVVFVSGYSTGIQYSYLFWYLQAKEGFSQIILGLSLLVTCCSEIPMFYISGWICQKVGYVSVLCIGLVAVSIRFLTYTIITQAWQVLLVEWLHGVSFALPFAAMCSYASVIAPKDTIATLISVSQTVYWGLGNMAGALIGGVLYQAYGGEAVFHISGVLCASVAGIYWLLLGPPDIISYCCKDNEKDEEKKEIASEKEGMFADEEKIDSKKAEEIPLHVLEVVA